MSQNAPGSRPVDALAPYDAVFVHSFGGPEAPEEVVPFLERVTGGRGIPRERLMEVGRHYFDRGGRSPINDENRALVAALSAELHRRDTPRPVLWGNRFAAPFTAEVIAQARAQGYRRLVVVPTSAYPSYSGCRAYREDLAAALSASVRPSMTEAGAGEERQDPRLFVDKIRPYALHPGFSATNARLVTEATRRLLITSGLPAGDIRLLFVTHSIPLSQDETSGPPPGGHYLRWHRGLADAIAAEVSATLETSYDADLAFCSRSGPPAQPWLEPDVSDRMDEMAAAGVRGVVVSPIGFTADHMEVVYDLDDAAAATARRLGMAFARVPTVRADAEFVTGLVDLLEERAAEARGAQPRRPSWPRLGDPLPAECAAGCCANPRGPRPAVCGAAEGA